MDINLLVSIAILLLLAVIVVAAIARRRRSARLAERFGPEYQRAVQRTGSRAQAEAELRSREHRVYKLLDIVPLAPHEAQRFRMEWQGVQSRFVDNPRSAVTEADLLVRDVMMRRGYPMADFETQAADLSVDHPVVVDNYRAAHAIALRELHGQASTEDLRQALVHYRTLFDELLQPAPAQTRRGPVQDTRAGKIRGGLVPPERALASDRPARERPGEP
jgi:hypothetical protein